MSLGSVGRVEEVNRSDLDSHADCCVCEKEVLVLNDFDREVTVTGWYPEGETQSLRIVSAAMGYTIPESGQTVLLIAHQSIFSPSLNHNLLSTMQTRLHDVIVNETPKFQSLNPTKLSHSISVRGDNVEDVLLIPLELHGVVSCFPTFKPTQLEFETCDRYELTYEYPEYNPSAKTFHEQESSMMYSWGNIKVSGDCHPKRRQVCSLRQKEAEIRLLSSKYSDTSAKLQDLSSVLDDGKLLAELDDNNFNLNISLVKSEMRDKAGVDAATLAKNWGIGIEAAKRTRLVTTQRGVRRMIHPSLTKRYKTNDRHLRYCRLPVTMYADTMYSTILSRQKNKASQIFCTDFGFVRDFPLKKEKEAHEDLSLLFHRDGVPNVMVMDGAKAQVEG
jgi:transcription initiation factor TFIIIB Brf1 subunit/transcription initiation factor TFIIB